VILSIKLSILFSCFFLYFANVIIDRVKFFFKFFNFFDFDKAFFNRLRGVSYLKLKFKGF